jgi:hypothetical protein
MAPDADAAGGLGRFCARTKWLNERLPTFDPRILYYCYARTGFCPTTKSARAGLPLHCRQPKVGTVSKVRPSEPAREPWHAVSVVGGPKACPAVEALRDKRFLSADAPRLPLPDCTSVWRCKCAYKHHIDRRGTPRRSIDRTGLPSPLLGKDRRIARQARGRRTDD